MQKVCEPPAIHGQTKCLYPPDYIDTMKFGYVKPNGDPVITNSLLQGGIVSAYYLGTLFGALFGGWVGEKIGRIRTIAIGAAWGVLGASLQCSAQNHDWYEILSISFPRQSGFPLSICISGRQRFSSPRSLPQAILVAFGLSIICPCLF